jgi:hypothetical protein
MQRDYQAFEAAVTAGYDADTAVERELVLRLASVLWRLRRATGIEAALFERGCNAKTDITGGFLRLAAFPLDRLSRYEHLLWRQARQLVFALKCLRQQSESRSGMPWLSQTKNQPFLADNVTHRARGLWLCCLTSRTTNMTAQVH